MRVRFVESADPDAPAILLEAENEIDGIFLRLFFTADSRKKRHLRVEGAIRDANKSLYTSMKIGWFEPPK